MMQFTKACNFYWGGQDSTMRKIEVTLFICSAIFLMLQLDGCGSKSSSSDTSSSATTTQPGTIDGKALYTDNCSPCHGALATSSKRGATVAMIQNAISGNLGGMGQFSTFTTEQIQAIATALSTTP
jgi:mono/diheme cytochrome c family protein